MKLNQIIIHEWKKNNNINQQRKKEHIVQKQLHKVDLEMKNFLSF